MLLCACAYGVKSDISLDTGDSASNAVVDFLFLLTSVVQNVCICILWTSCLRQKYIIIICDRLRKSVPRLNKHVGVIE